MSDAFFLFDDDEMLVDWWGGHSTVGPPSASALCGLTDCETGPPGVSGLTLSLEGSFYDLGDARLDADGDGTSDSVTLSDDDGLTVYTDSDGDGMVDRVTTVRFDGGYASWAMSSGGELDEGRAAQEHNIGGTQGHNLERRTSARGPHNSSNEISYQVHSLGGAVTHLTSHSEKSHSTPGGDEDSSRDGTTRDHGLATGDKRSSRSKQCLDTWTRGRWECIERGSWD
ncbi:hypothetical protein I6J22_05230 [Corynebacterium kroppenstedtii]|uniref:DUF6802 domain-containing protein n=1 Tax=Corynebacterium kroppenstedtii (strain DSM 44385 / JCM 11950 / CIP 105744 / CCUG 35717) TaxID=645127 RepID=C4LGT4_CORK4|nr:DUF6802 family protein [Corynebacterium kroppenstedtii]ACR17039.1 hypothetical protein ckrop_0252 [Corynebacterium kroppenstedtii DSM 44385]QRP09688.1 hypothetical protein I6J22_05230 [Corynebacterium kroppenstedtii]